MGGGGGIDQLLGMGRGGPQQQCGGHRPLEQLLGMVTHGGGFTDTFQSQEAPPRAMIWGSQTPGAAATNGGPSSCCAKSPPKMGKGCRCPPYPAYLARPAAGNATPRCAS